MTIQSYNRTSESGCNLPANAQKKHIPLEDTRFDFQPVVPTKTILHRAQIAQDPHDITQQETGFPSDASFTHEAPGLLTLSWPSFLLAPLLPRHLRPRHPLLLAPHPECPPPRLPRTGPPPSLPLHPPPGLGSIPLLSLAERSRHLSCEPRKMLAPRLPRTGPPPSL